LLLLLTAALCVHPVDFVRANVKLPAIISDHMVLQKSDKAAVWGWADPAEEVTVTLDTKTASAITGADGKWKVTLNLSNSAQGPFQMTVAARNSIVISDVLVGQVWVASGQSNMELPLRGTFGSDAEITHSDNPLIRQFLVAHAEKMLPQDNCNGKWTLASPATVGNYSAVAYYFSKKLQASLKVPVGFIQSSFGGTQLEQWMSSEGFDADPDLKAMKDLSVQSWANLVAQRLKYPDQLNAWLAQTGREDKSTVQPANFAGLDIPTTDWTEISLPGVVAGPGLPEAGAFWLRKDVNLTAVMIGAPAAAKGLEINYNAGANDFETAFWNGQKISQFLPKDRSGPALYSFRRITIPTNLLKVGRNVLALRFYSPIQAPAVTPNKPPPSGIPMTIGVWPLDGKWLAKAEYALPPLDPAGLASVPPDPGIVYKPIWDRNMYETTQLYNGMINPIIPYTIAGAIWYQGESNANRAFQYRTVLPLLIKDWRAHWGQGDFPFYFCQLAGEGGTSRLPTENSWAEVRESQLLSLKVPNTGMAVLIDVGEGNIHPRDKIDPGQRLAFIALANTYHENIPYSGPIYDSSKVEGNIIRISFQHTDDGLVAKPLNEVGKAYYEDPKKVAPIPLDPKSALQGFAICGADHKWVWAEAAIEGETVVASSAQVPQPVAVRYAWDSLPICNLFNGADLPASPFRTDDFPLTTADAGYGKIVPKP
jgi:sialate O-acetylesterase